MHYVGAICSVYGYPCTTGNIACDLIAWHWLAAVSQAGEQFACSKYLDAKRSRNRRGCCLGYSGLLLLHCLLERNLAGAHLTPADRSVEVLHRLVFERVRQFLSVTQAHSKPPHFLLPYLSALLNVVCPGLFLEPLPNSVTSAGSIDVSEVGVEPVPARSLVFLTGDDLYGVTVSEVRSKGYQLAINLCTDTPVSQTGMDLVGKIQRCRTGRQVF